MKNILLIEDDLLVLDNITELLESEGFNVICATDGMQGLELANSSKPDLIISDIMMPKLDGFGVLKKIGENPDTAGIPFVFLSARTDKSDFRLGMELGADDFLFKPFTPDELFGTVNARLKKQKSVSQASDAIIREFSLNVASTIPHELRTPLNGILASASLLNDYFDSMDTEAVKEIHSTMLFSARRLENLIYKYLLYVDTELILLDADKRELASDYFTVFASNTITNTIKETIARRGKDHNVIHKIADANVKIYEDHLNFIIRELLENAIKFSKVGSEIEVKSWIDDGYYKIEFNDYGIGMTNSEIAKIGALKQFGRVVNEQQGLGLGLAIIQRMMKIYKGNLKIESIKGEFTKVTISLLCEKGN